MAVLNYTRQCKICNKDFVRTEKGQSVKYCSDGCKKENQRIYDASVTPEKKKEYQQRRNLKRKNNHNYTWEAQKQRAIDNKRHGPFTCKGCNKEFYTCRLKYIDYCSRDCAFKNYKNWYVTHYRGVKKEEKAIKIICYLKECVGCGNRFHTHDNRNVYCNKSCYPLDERKEVIKNRRIEEHKLKPSINCSVCNVNFTRLYKNASSICSDNCVKEKERTIKRIEKGKRRAIERGLESDNIDPIKIFERDKWTCHICNKKTDKNKRGTYEDKAPELDHIISLAEGGTHTFGNVACSCRKCNGDKGSKSLGQLSFSFCI